MGIYRAGSPVNDPSGNTLVSASVFGAGSKQARCHSPNNDSSALHRWWAILDFWRRTISSQPEQAARVVRILTFPSAANTLPFNSRAAPGDLSPIEVKYYAGFV
jgi:hypothetical protein